MSNKYTVITARSTDWVDTSVCHVEAPTPTIAGRQERVRQQAQDPTTPVSVIAVFAGHIHDRFQPLLDTEEYERQIMQEEEEDV